MNAKKFPSAYMTEVALSTRTTFMVFGDRKSVIKEWAKSPNDGAIMSIQVLTYDNNVADVEVNTRFIVFVGATKLIPDFDSEDNGAEAMPPVPHQKEVPAASKTLIIGEAE